MIILTLHNLFFRLRKDFKQLLEETGYVTPGKRLEEVGLRCILLVLN